MLHPYELYSDYDNLWFSKLPVYWQCRKIKDIFIERNEMVSSEEFSALSVGKMGVVPQLKNAAKSENKDKRKLVRAGDIVINTRSDRKGACGVSTVDGSVSLIYTVLKLKEEMNPLYFHYLMRSSLFSEEFYRRGKGIVSDLWTTKYNEMKDISIPVPPRSQQDRIVEFLNSQHPKISKFIELIEKLQGLTKENLDNTITEYCFRGLNNNDFRNSGIEWIGEVPIHWNIKKLKSIVTINPSIKKEISKFTPTENIVFLPMEKVSVFGDYDNDSKIQIQKVRTGFTGFAKNDVIVAKITPCFENGKGACLDLLDSSIGFGSTEFITLRPTQDILSRYLYYVTKTSLFRTMGKREMRGAAGQKRISAAFISEFKLPLPTLAEQKEIIDVLDRKTSNTKHLLNQLTKLSETLSEYGERLFSDIVLGKFDVPIVSKNNMIRNTISSSIQKPTVFLSYCWFDSNIANLIDEKLLHYFGDKIHTYRDVRDISYKNSLKDFMDSISSHDFIIMIISDHYLKSRNCMYEATKVINTPDFHDKLLFVVVSEKDSVFYEISSSHEKIHADIYSENSLKYIKYWDQKIISFEKEIKEISEIASASADMKELLIRKKIQLELPILIEFLKNHKGISVTELVHTKFRDIREIIQNKIDASFKDIKNN